MVSGAILPAELFRQLGQRDKILLDKVKEIRYFIRVLNRFNKNSSRCGQFIWVN